MYVLESLNPTLNYFKNTKVKHKIITYAILSIINSNKQHSQLIRFDRICAAVCVGRTPNGNFVNAMKLLDKEGTQDYHVYKDTYTSIFEEYKRVTALAKMKSKLFQLCHFFYNQNVPALLA